ncbi:hypothetical protein M1583_02760, partial [Candidatus Marsarchaeota archaeon]|nr:hypothetical protein [Candidatus Marsarchaeota archaeon]
EMCGVTTLSSSERVLTASGRTYCISCSQKLGLGTKTKTNCAICGKSLAKGEVKMVLPSKSFGETAMPLESRLACISCYSSMATRNKHVDRAKAKATAKVPIRKALRERLIQQLAERATA